jgi:transcriptional regulator with XRE-family HTH domain
VAAPPTPAETQLALRLRRLREQIRMTQTQLALAFSEEQEVGAASISSWENMRTTATPPQSRLEPYARLVATASRAPGERRLITAGQLSSEEQQVRSELLSELTQLWEAARGSQEQAAASSAATYRSWFFDDDGPVSIICPKAPQEARGPLAETTNPNFTQAHSYADLDALIELFGHIRAENEPTFPVNFKEPSEVKADDLSGHLVLLGGVGWNDLTDHLLRKLTRLPVRQVTDERITSGEIFVVGHGEEEKRFFPEWSAIDQNILVEDVCFLARVRNPYNSSRTLTLVNGIHSRGVLGAVRTLTDARHRDINESYLARRFSGDYGLLMRVPVYRGEASTPDLANPETILYEWPEREQADR